MGAIFRPFTKILGMEPKPFKPAEDPAEALEAESKKKKSARQAALASLNPTGALGAGTPETTRRTTLGV